MPDKPTFFSRYVYGCRNCDRTSRALSVKTQVRCRWCGRRKVVSLGGLVVLVIALAVIGALAARWLGAGRFTSNEELRLGGRLSSNRRPESRLGAAGALAMVRRVSRGGATREAADPQRADGSIGAASMALEEGCSRIPLTGD